MYRIILDISTLCKFTFIQYHNLNGGIIDIFMIHIIWKKLVKMLLFFIYRPFFNIIFYYFLCLPLMRTSDKLNKTNHKYWFVCFDSQQQILDAQAMWSWSQMMASKRLVSILNLGCISYRKAWDLQQKLVRRQLDILQSCKKNPHQGTQNLLLLCSHNPVYTIGNSFRRSNLDILPQ